MLTIPKRFGDQENKVASRIDQVKQRLTRYFAAVLLRMSPALIDWFTRYTPKTVETRKAAASRESLKAEVAPATTGSALSVAGLGPFTASLRWTTGCAG
ncbi:hypothetical protein AMJ44_09915 [candidate division WOR-1 bacterium DG_54_3]|uniref:Uncharacterized protein n=1 Tax=candidate division WOR-1 bacterium DG_54_3 TaxID=1703775 RepID=A0A0S7XUK7_UNCSA|nr:MAG: hypothetical protein AMJ44_09915 [candidate division WOR-1 bacterium DG_54_3]